MTVKRRTIWMSDEDWAKLQDRAEKQARNASEEIREALFGLGFPYKFYGTPPDERPVDAAGDRLQWGDAPRKLTPEEQREVAIVSGFGHPVAAPKPSKAKR